MNSKPLARNNHLPQAQGSNQEPSMVFFDPTLIKAARNIYRSYCNLKVTVDSNSLKGVIINRDSHRGQLAFTSKPVLLPRECFISLQQIEAEIY